MATIPVKWFSSIQEGAPVLQDSWGQMTSMLDAVLVNGFNSKTATSITRTGTTVTVTFAAHKFLADQVILISGANETDYNGEWRITTVTTTTVTFEIVATPATPATGTITVKAAPLGWQLQFSATIGTSTAQGGKRIYRSNSASSNKNVLRVDDYQPLNAGGTIDYNVGYNKFARVGMAQSYTDVNTVSGAQAPFDPASPNKNWVSTGTGTSVIGGWYKWYYTRYPTSGAETSSEASVKTWWLVGDDRGFHLFISPWSVGNSYGYMCYTFTDFNSTKANDLFNTALTASDWYIAASTAVYADQNNYWNRSQYVEGKILMKDYHQMGAAVRFKTIGLGTVNGIVISGNSTGVSFPDPTDFSMLLHPLFIVQENGVFRGNFPGVYQVLNNSPTIMDGEIFTNVPGMSGKKFLMLNTTVSGAPTGKTVLDITGPWW